VKHWPAEIYGCWPRVLGLGHTCPSCAATDLWLRFENVVLVHGIPLREELVYRDLIDEIARKQVGCFQYISCVSREGNPEGLKGRITHVFEKGELEQRAELKIEKSLSTIMLCGNHNMIKGMQQLLSQRDMRRLLRHKPG